jgi:hypothetical protein
VVSTPSSRDICNQPELLGCAYTDALRRAVTATLARAPFRPLVEGHPESRVCVLNFLRGGLNFDLRGALAEAYGFNTHSSAFMSSQRYRIHGRWVVREDMYRKLRIPDGALILTGDVVATGVTVSHGLEVLHDHLVEIGSSLRGLVFFTIGCHKLEKALAEMDTRFRASFPGYRETHAVYLEGKFRLVDSRTELRIGIPGTDLIRRDALLAPELEWSQYDDLSRPLERCAIYDAGSRAFDIPNYLADVLGYWRQVAALAREGMSLADAVLERWPDADPGTPEAHRRRRLDLWRGLDPGELDALYERAAAAWSRQRAAGLATPGALESLSAQRVATLSRILNLE